MNNLLNFLMFEYAVDSLKRRGFKNIFIFIVFSLIVFLLSSVLFISSALKNELDKTLISLPEIFIQKIVAGRQADIEASRVEEIVKIAGVEEAFERVWGYYYFDKAGVNFTIIGTDIFAPQYKKALKDAVEKIDIEKFEGTDVMFVGEGVKKILQENYYKDYFNFIKPDGTFKKISMAGTFKNETSLESNDVILLSKNLAIEIFGTQNDFATDIVVRVPNVKEIPTIAQKIKNLYPDTRVISKEDLKISYQNIFDYKSGLFMAMFIISLVTFFMIVYDKASGLSSEEKREIGILKAIGWKIDDIMVEKFYESVVIAIGAFLFGISVAIFYVFFLKAPLLNLVFTGYSTLKPPFELPFHIDLQTIFLIFFASVPIYIASVLIPSWKAATLEADEVIR